MPGATQKMEEQTGGIGWDGSGRGQRVQTIKKGLGNDSRKRVMIERQL